jgi:hypothetical protein
VAAVARGDVRYLDAYGAYRQSFGLDNQRRVARRRSGDRSGVVAVHRFSFLLLCSEEKPGPRETRSRGAAPDFMGAYRAGPWRTDDLAGNHGEAMVKRIRAAGGCLLIASILLGTLSDTPRERPQLMLGGYYVLASDFHIHSFPFSWALLSPLDNFPLAPGGNALPESVEPHPY